MKRCKWVGNRSNLLKAYHDEEWGRPIYDDHTLYEMLILESFSTGLSWLIILTKRDNFRRAFDDFDIEKVMNYQEDKIEELMQDKGIVRHLGKIKAAITNSRVFHDIQLEYGTFAEYLWHYTDYKILYIADPITYNELSDRIASDLKKRGMKFFGTVTVYAYLQAVGVINSHESQCFCFVSRKE